jgi:hypothetical protein
MIINDVGSIEKGDLANPEVDDLLDDLGEMVTKNGQSDDYSNEKWLLVCFVIKIIAFILHIDLF